jgi:hypothetical protein
VSSPQCDHHRKKWLDRVESVSIFQHILLIDFVNFSYHCSGCFKVENLNYEEKQSGKGDKDEEIDKERGAGRKEEKDEQNEDSHEEIISPASYVNLVLRKAVN